MGKINAGRVFLGGILAGILVNLSEFILNEKVMKSAWEEAMKGKQVQMGSIAVWVVWGFVYGILCVWLYAAIRPRFGAGAGTAAIAGFMAWIFTTLLSTVGMINMGIFPPRLLAIGAIWALPESILATILGAWIYKE